MNEPSPAPVLALDPPSVRRIRHQLLHNTVPIDRNSVLFNGMTAGDYCIQKIRQDRVYRRTYEKNRRKSK